MLTGPYPARAAEKALWKEEFRNAATVHRNGGTLVGSPEVKDGVTLDGSTQYCTHDITGVLNGRSVLGIVVEFWPDFDYDEDALRYIFDSVSQDYLARKDANAGNNTLTLYLGGTAIASIPSATYSPAWTVGERNVLVISSNGASTDARLNGTQILTADATAWTPSIVANLYSGSRSDGNFKFDGEIKSITIHGCLLTQADADAIQDGSLFRYQQRSELWVDCAEAIIDGVSNRTLDKSRHGRPVLLGDGAGTGTPTWEAPGFTFDGVDDKLTLPSDPTGTFTVAWKRRNEATVFESDLTTWNLLKAAGGFEGLLDYLAYWDFALSPVQQDDLGIMWSGGRA